MKRRLLALTLALALLGIPLPRARAAEAGHSGSLDMPKLSREEIVELLREHPLGYEGDAMEVVPMLQDPFTTGTVREAALTAAIGRFSALRRLAGLPAVELDPTLTANAQYGAVLLAALGKLSHSPERPVGMDDDFYQKGRTAAASSNIYQGTNAILPQAVEAFFDDSDYANVSTLGHRRWMLNPTMAKTGLGFSPSRYTYSGQTYNFATLWAFDRSGSGVDYNFIAWPASGSFPGSLFHANEAWSITLDPGKYAVPSLEEVTVSLTRDADGKTWFFSGEESYTAANTGAYFNIDTARYGESNCIIFRPALDVTSYRGSYTVSVSGLRTAGGAEAVLRYQVDFFDLEGAAPVEVEGVELNRTTLELDVGQTGELTATVLPADAAEQRLVWESSDLNVATVRGGKVNAVGPGTAVITASAAQDREKRASCTVTVAELPAVYRDVPEGVWFEEPVYFVTRRGLFQGVGGDAFDPEGHMTRGMAMVVLARLAGADVTPQGSEAWDLRGRRWAVSNRISDGREPERDITVQELAVMFYKFAALQGVAEAPEGDRLADVPDGALVDPWALEGMNWAVDVGLLIGDEQGFVKPRSSIMRSQVAIIFQRYVNLFEAD